MGRIEDMKKLPLLVFLIFLILTLVILLNNNFPPLKFLSSGVQSIFSFPKSTLYGLSHVPDSASSLKKENKELTKKLLNYERLKKDNDALRSQFDSRDASTYTLMPVKVLGFSGNFFQPESLTVDNGSASGVKNGMAVILENNLIGTISKVSEKYSQVMLATNPKFKILAKTSDTGAPGVAQGNTDFILFDKVAVNDKITDGSFLVSAGSINDNGIGVPPDLVIGKIASTNRSKSLPFQTAKVQTPINFIKLETVFIVEKF